MATHPTPAGRRAPLVFAALVAVVAVVWRLVGLTDWPSPDYPTLQYESALAARPVWLAADPRARTPDRAAWLDAAGTQNVTSPPVLPGLVAAVSAATGEEVPWASRLFATGFWLAAGVLIGAAAVRLTGSRCAGAVGFAWFVLCPVGMVMSRSFQVEAVLVFALAAATYHLARPGRGLRVRLTLLETCPVLASGGREPPDSPAESGGSR
ncbi:MAG: hypothetical protein K2X82_24600, partial [Gemmataceae bacterium]|nr:hypothetical protein [Gemmataceae bacterium]